MEDCIEHEGAKVDGYGVFKLDGRSVRAHRFSYCVYMSIPLSEIDGLVVMHKCDNRACINPRHLSIGTHADNCADKVKKGRQAKGERVGNSKLKPDHVFQIKAMIYSGLSAQKIAKIFDVSSVCIGKIRSGKTWRHL